MDILRDAIFYGKLRPGELLTELPLAKKLEVSQSTVREALADLEHYGLVTRVPNRGTVVTTITAADVHHRMKVRLALEEMAFTESCKLLDKADIVHLQDLARRIDSLVEAGDSIHAGEADLNFHRYVWRKSGNPVLCQTLDVLTVPLFAFMGVMFTMAGIDSNRNLALPHDDLVTALRDGNPEVVRKAVRDHLCVPADSAADAALGAAARRGKRGLRRPKPEPIRAR